MKQTQEDLYRMTTDCAPNGATSAEGYFLSQLFRLLNQGRIRYVVMRNYDPLPFSSGGSDLDLLVAPEDAQKIRIALSEAMALSGGVPIGITESVGFFKAYMLGKAPGQSQWWGLRVDVNLGVYYQGSRLIDSDAVDFTSTYHNGVAVLPETHAGMLGVLKEILNNGKFAAHYMPAARHAAQTDWSSVSALLEPMGPGALAQLKNLLVASAPPADFAAWCTNMRRILLRHSLARRPIAYLMGRLRFAVSRIHRYLKPSGMIIAVLGVDGAGKSTLIQAMLPALQAATHNAVWIQHLRPSLLPPLARLKGAPQAPAGPTLDPHGSKPSGRIGSIVRICYLLLDYVLGYWLRVRPIIAKQPTIALFDRYVYDIAFDPRRFRINLPERIIRWLSVVAPEPHLVICLTGNPEVIAARKKELPVEETRRQIEALTAFTRSNPRAVLISTDGPIDETRDHALEAILGHLHHRQSDG